MVSQFTLTATKRVPSSPPESAPERHLRKHLRATLPPRCPSWMVQLLEIWRLTSVYLNYVCTWMAGGSQTTTTAISIICAPDSPRMGAIFLTIVPIAITIKKFFQINLNSTQSTNRGMGVILKTFLASKCRKRCSIH